MDGPIVILVTAVGGGAVGRQIVKALQMSELPLRIVVTDASPFAFGLTKAERAYVVPLANDPNYIDTLLEICAHEGVQFLAPGFEAELECVSANRARFEAAGVRLLINDAQVIDLCQDKWRTFEFLRDQAFPYAESWLIESKTDLEQITTFPVVVKPALGGGGSRYVYIARDCRELEMYASLLLRDRQVTMVQEYVGTSDEEYTVGVLTTPTGELVGSIALRRLILEAISTKLRIPALDGTHSLTISSGFSQGVIDEYPDVRATCEAIAARLGSRGPLNIQCRKTKRGVVAFEINPRLSGTTSIRALVGFNEPEALIRYHLTGETTSLANYRRGYAFRELRERFVSFEQMANISRTVSEGAVVD